MADYETIRAGRVGTRGLVIDEGLRAHMNKVYGLMSVAMVITAGDAWAISGLAMSPVPTAYQIGADTYLTGFGAGG
jgi:FtsH-binding integral membrane protein